MEWLRVRGPAAMMFLQRLEMAERNEIRLLMCRLNLGEVHYSIVHRWGHLRAADYKAKVASLPIEIIPIDDNLVDEAADIKANYPVSYADCFVAALARRHHATVISGDADFQRLASVNIVRLDWLGA
jgi:predicted nucleic acid-binding protein